MPIEMTKIDCEFCKIDTWVKPNGDCPTCGRLLTGFPGLHMDPVVAAARMEALKKKSVTQ